MRTIFSLIIGLVVGVSLIALGVSIFGYGLGQPITCRQSPSGKGGCGNLPLIIRVFVAVTGLVTLVGAIIYAVRVWEGAASEISVD